MAVSDIKSTYILAENTLPNSHDGTMRFLDWLANHLTYPMLKRWMMIGGSLVLIGLLSLSL
jgi:hypothetical protein